MTFLRQLSHGPAAYIDDIWLVGKTKRKVEQKMITARAVLTNVDFVVSKKRPVLNTTQKLEHFGFVNVSVPMSVRLTEQKNSINQKSCI